MEWSRGGGRSSAKTDGENTLLRSSFTAGERGTTGEWSGVELTKQRGRKRKGGGEVCV